jgi:hypothetical protein
MRAASTVDAELGVKTTLDQLSMKVTPCNRKFISIPPVLTRNVWRVGENNPVQDYSFVWSNDIWPHNFTLRIIAFIDWKAIEIVEPCYQMKQLGYRLITGLIDSVKMDDWLEQ